MSMIDASEPLFKDLFPNGCIVYDRTGRELINVIACNPETGEVITYTQMPFIVWWARVFWRFRFWQPRGLIAWSHEGCMLRRHGFWPAPLKLTPTTPTKKLSTLDIDKLIEEMEA